MKLIEKIRTFKEEVKTQKRYKEALIQKRLAMDFYKMKTGKDLA